MEFRWASQSFLFNCEFSSNFKLEKSIKLNLIFKKLLASKKKKYLISTGLTFSFHTSVDCFLLLSNTAQIEAAATSRDASPLERMARRALSQQCGCLSSPAPERIK